MKTTVTISLGENAFAMASKISSLSVPLGTIQPFSDLSDLTKTIITTYPYATYEPNFWLLDGNYKFLPAGYVGVHVGLFGTELDGGPVGENYWEVTAPELTIIFDTPQTIVDGMVLTFSPATNDFPEEFSIEYRDEEGATIRTDNYLANTDVVFPTNITVAAVKKIIITFWKSSKPFRYARMTHIDLDEVIRFTGTDIRKAYVVEQIDPSGLTLPINTLEAILHSDAGLFDVIEPVGLYAQLKEHYPLDVNATIDGDPVFMGRFYFKEWNSPNSQTIHIYAVDALGVLDELPYLGENIPLGVYAETHLSSLLDPFYIPFYLDTYWDTFGISGYVSRSTARVGLQQLMFALYYTDTTALINTARLDGIVIEAMPNTLDIADVDYEITVADRGAGSSITLLPLITGIELEGHSPYSVNDISEIGSFALTGAGDHTVLFNEPYADVTITSGANGTITFQGANYVLITTTATTTLILSGKRLYNRTKMFSHYNTSLPSTTRPKIVSVSSTTLVPIVTAQYKTDFLYGYYNRRYKQTTKLFGSKVKPGDTVLTTLATGRQLLGMIERMETDLARGFVSTVEIVGEVVPV